MLFSVRTLALHGATNNEKLIILLSDLVVDVWMLWVLLGLDENPKYVIRSILMDSFGTNAFDAGQTAAVLVTIMWLYLIISFCLASGVVIMAAWKGLQIVFSSLVTYWSVFGTLGTLKAPPSEWTRTVMAARDLLTSPYGMLVYKDNTGTQKHYLPLKSTNEGRIIAEVTPETPDWLKTVLACKTEDLKESRNPSRQGKRYDNGDPKIPLGYMFNTNGEPVGGFTRLGDYLVTNRHIVRPYEDGNNGSLRICKFDKEGVITQDSPRVTLDAKRLMHPALRTSQGVMDVVYYAVPSNYWDKLGISKRELVDTLQTDQPAVTFHVEVDVSNPDGPRWLLYSSACEIKEGYAPGTRYHNGDTAKGDCGFPVLIRGNGSNWRIAGIHKEGSITPFPDIKNGFTPAVFLQFFIDRLAHYESPRGGKEGSSWYDGDDRDDDKWDAYEVEEKEGDYWWEREDDSEWGIFSTIKDMGRRAKRKARNMKEDDQEDRRRFQYQIDRTTGNDRIVVSRAGKKAKEQIPDVAPELLRSNLARFRQELEPFKTSNWADFEGPIAGLEAVLDKIEKETPEKEGPTQYETKPGFVGFFAQQLSGKRSVPTEVKETSVASVIEAKREIQPSFGKSLQVLHADGVAWQNFFEYVDRKLVSKVVLVDAASDGIQAFDVLHGQTVPGVSTATFELPWDNDWGKDVPADKMDAWKQILHSMLFEWELYLRELEGTPMTLVEFVRKEFVSMVNGNLMISEQVCGELAELLGAIIVYNEQWRSVMDKAFVGFDRWYRAPVKTRLKTMKANDFFVASPEKEGPMKKVKFHETASKPPVVPAKLLEVVAESSEEDSEVAAINDKAEKQDSKTTAYAEANSRRQNSRSIGTVENTKMFEYFDRLERQNAALKEGFDDLRGQMAILKAANVSVKAIKDAASNFTLLEPVEQPKKTKGQKKREREAKQKAEKEAAKLYPDPDLAVADSLRAQLEEVVARLDTVKAAKAAVAPKEGPN